MHDSLGLEPLVRGIPSIRSRRGPRRRRPAKLHADKGYDVEILSADPGRVAEVLAGMAAGLEETVESLLALQSADEAKRRGGAAGIENVLRRGNAGRIGVPGEHGEAPAAYATVAVRISDRPGELARIFADAERAGVDIKDIRIDTRPAPRQAWSDCW